MIRDNPERTRKTFYDKGLWVTRDGRVYKPNGFDDGHLINTIVFLINKHQHRAHEHAFAEHLRAELGNRPRWVLEVLTKRILDQPEHFGGLRSGRKTEVIEWWTYYAALDEEHGMTEVELELFNQLLNEIGTRAVNSEGEFIDDVAKD